MPPSPAIPNQRSRNPIAHGRELPNSHVRSSLGCSNSRSAKNLTCFAETVNLEDQIFSAVEPKYDYIGDASIYFRLCS